MQAQNSVLVDLVYKNIKMTDLVTNMNIFKDLATARHSFHIAKNFMKQSRIQAELLKRRKDVVESIMDCLRSRELDLPQKRECLQLLPFVVTDEESRELLIKSHVEEHLVDSLKSHFTTDQLTGTLLKSVISLAASQISSDSEQSMGATFI